MSESNERKKIKIGFLGYGTKALDCLMEHPLFEVRYFFVPEARLCADVYKARERYRGELDMEVIGDNAQLAARFAQIQDVDCFLMNACSIILHARTLSHMKVFNIHPGDLHTNRGHHPHLWTVLLGERRSKIVLHSVCEEIDAGGIVKSIEVPVYAEDGAKEVLGRLEDNIPGLLDALYLHLTEQTEYEEMVSGGNYRRIMMHDDYEICLATEPPERMRRKILARNLHHGAFFYYGKTRIYVDDILSYREYGEKKDGAITIRIDPEEQIVHIDAIWRSICFHLHHVEKTETGKTERRLG